MLGPLTKAKLSSSIHVNWFGMISKGHNSGTDLSFPQGHSMNDGIDLSLCSMTYMPVDKVANGETGLGNGALMAKVDFESAYRLIPVHPQDRPPQAVVWDVKVYVDHVLPFGLCLATQIFQCHHRCPELDSSKRGSLF